jgi:hypothetical protein
MQSVTGFNSEHVNIDAICNLRPRAIDPCRLPLQHLRLLKQRERNAGAVVVRVLARSTIRLNVAKRALSCFHRARMDLF